jgi:hypothetical protein
MTSRRTGPQPTGHAATRRLLFAAVLGATLVAACSPLPNPNPTSPANQLPGVGSPNQLPGVGSPNVLPGVGSPNP